MDSDTRRLLERGVNALEAMVEDPVIDVPVKPPVCPHCEKLNPTVRCSESEAEGPLFEFVIMCECKSCHRVFYAIAEGWNCVRTVGDAELLMQERVELAGYHE